jgi:subtilisin family serine protease
MSKERVLIELEASQPDAFEAFSAALELGIDSTDQAESMLGSFAGLDIDVDDSLPPVPMFSAPGETPRDTFSALAEFTSTDTNPDMSSTTMVVSAEVGRRALDELRARQGVTVWPDSRLTLLEHPHAGGSEDGSSIFDLATSQPSIDCRPFRPAATIETIRTLLGVDAIWRDGFRGQNVVVGIIDEGVNGTVYPVVGGLSGPNLPSPGSAEIDSHGSMCAADVLIAAPAAKLYDYPFLGVPRSGGALAMFNAVLEQRRRDGTPHLTNNSYGFTGVPPRDRFPDHEVWNPQHPLHRKVREVILSGAPAFFAAGNCGAQCPSRNCQPTGIGPGSSIHGSNSLVEVITIAAVNSRHERIGYSSEGPGMFENEKPDLASYSHIFANFGPGRPAGGDASRFDNGTSAATPVAAGVAALLMSALPQLTPDALRAALIAGAVNIGTPGWDPEYGHGVVNAAASYSLLRPC